MADTYLTRYTLLERLQSSDDVDEAWEEFASIYHPFILILLRSMGVRWEEQDDLAQLVMMKVLKNVGNFKEKSRFRTWLMTIVRNTTYTQIRKMHTTKEREIKYASEHPFHEMKQDEFEAMYTKEWKQYLCRTAFEHIKTKFTGKAIQVFEMTMEEVAIDKICQKLDLTKESVYCLRSRVKTALAEELLRLRRQLEE